MWQEVDNFFVYGINFAKGVAWAHLLSAKDFSLLGNVGPFYFFRGAESGLVVAVIVKGYGPRQLTLERQRGETGGFYGLLALSAFAIASWCDKPVLMLLMWVMALSMVVHVAGIVATARLWHTNYLIVWLVLMRLVS